MSNTANPQSVTRKAQRLEGTAQLCDCANFLRTSCPPVLGSQGLEVLAALVFKNQRSLSSRECGPSKTPDPFSWFRKTSCTEGGADSTHPLPRQSGRSHQGGPVGGHLVEAVVIFLTCP